MPYSITTKDGITVNNIPDDVDPHDERLKAKVAGIRAGGGTPAAAHAPDVPSAADKFDPTEGMSPVEKLGAGAISGLLDAKRGVMGFAARHGIYGNNEEVAKNTADMQALEQPLTKGGWGGAGHFVGENLPYMIPGGAAVKATQGLKMLPRLLGGTVLGSLEGGAQAALAPTGDPNADDAKRSDEGMLWGAAGNLGGEAVGKVLGGVVKKASPAAQEMVDTLKASPLGKKLNLLATDITDSPHVKTLTDALASLPIYGNPIIKGRAANQGVITAARTAETGLPTDALTPKNVDAIWSRLKGQYDTYRGGPDVPVRNTNQVAKEIRDDVEQYLKDTAQPGMAPITAAERATAATPPPLLPKAPSLTVQERIALRKEGKMLPPEPTAQALGPPTPKTLSASEVLDRRRAASTLAHNTQDEKLAAKYRALRDAYDDDLKATLRQEPHPVTGKTGPEEFDQLRKEWASAEEMKKAIKSGGLTPDLHLKSDAIEKGLPDTVRGGGTGTPAENFFQAADRRILPPPPGWNRSWITSLALGGGLGYMGDKIADNPVAGVGAAAAPYMLAKMLTGGGGRFATGTALGQKQMAEYVRLLTQQAIQHGGVKHDKPKKKD